jgi:hypothetical protein
MKRWLFALLVVGVVNCGGNNDPNVVNQAVSDDTTDPTANSTLGPTTDPAAGVTADKATLGPRGRNAEIGRKGGER